MDSAIEKQSIYEIYRACRLCGAGAGYKMPIIQSFVDLDDRDVQLKEKILDCIQIEVRQDDKMPPLICELCVDKVNDFYDFLTMCRQTNVRTRHRLGLPPMSSMKEASDNSDCILGLTEAIYVNSDSDSETLRNKKALQQKIRVKKPSELKGPQTKLESPRQPARAKPKPKSKQEPSPTTSRPRRTDGDDVAAIFDLREELLMPRSARLKVKHEPTPPRSTRLAKSSKDDDISLSRLQEQTPKSGPKSILKKDNDLKVVIKRDEATLLAPRLKRLESTSPASDSPIKKVKLSTKPALSSPATPKPKPPPKSTPTPRPPPKSSTPKSSPKAVKLPAALRAASPPINYECVVCALTLKSNNGYHNHMKTHQVGFTSPKLACKACREWFPSAEEAQVHHKRHSSEPLPYSCRECFADFNTLDEYDKHFGQKLCIPAYEVSDIKCDDCWHLFPTENLYNNHPCPKEDGRPGGKCFRCKKSYVLLRNLMKHEMNCSSKKKKNEIWAPSYIIRDLKPLRVRTARCDPLLEKTIGEHVDVSDVPVDFGYDSSAVYPFYMSTWRASDTMVSIDPTVKEELCNQEYTNWDSGSETDTLIPKVKTLKKLCLRVVHKGIGKVRTKKIETDKTFDSLFNDGDEDVRTNIDNIIDNLDDDLTKNDSGKNDETMNGVSEINDSVTESKTDSSVTVNGDVNMSVSEGNDSFKNNDKSNVSGDDKNDACMNDNKQVHSNGAAISENNYVNANNDSETLNNDTKVSAVNNNDINKRISGDNDLISGNDDNDDKNLLDELDAQIAVNSGSNSFVSGYNEKRKSKSKIEGDSPSKNIDNNDLDSISDEEFNFEN